MTSQAVAVECSSGMPAREKENLIASLAWLIRVRWYAIGILGLISVVFLGIFGKVSVEGPLVAVLSIVAIASLCNSAFAQKVHDLKLKKYEEICKDAWGQVLLDIWVIAALVHYCGGVENPLIVVTVLPLIVASRLLPRRTCNVLALFALVLTAGVAVLEVAGVLPHVQLSFTQGKALWLDGGYIVLLMGALAFLFFGSVRFSTLRPAGLAAGEAESPESSRFIRERMHTIEESLAAEKMERARLDEELRRQLAATEQDKERLAKAIDTMEDGVMSRMADLSKEVNELKDTPDSVAADLEKEIAGLEKSLEAVEAARASATPAVKKEKPSRGAAQRIPRPPKKEEEDEGEDLEAEEETEIALKDPARESLEDEDDEDEEAETESEPYEFDEEKEEDEDFEGQEKDEPVEFEDEPGTEEFADPQDTISQTLLNSIREIKDIPQAESVLMDVVLADDLPDVTADQQMLGQMFVGILRHSLASMPDGGRMAVHTSCEPDCVCVKITDTSELTKDVNLERSLAAEKRIARKIKVVLSTDANAEEGATYLVKIPL